MLKCSAALWSAKLGELTREIQRVQRHVARFHFDVADGRYVPELLFSPGMLRAVRPASSLPFEVHLMVAEPMAWIAPFLEAGADAIIFDFETAAKPADVIEAIKSKDKQAGINLTLSRTIEDIEPYWEALDLVCIAGAAPGGDQAIFSSVAVEKIHVARELIFEHRGKTELEAEGGIVRETLPVLKAAGADYIVAGSILFDNPRSFRQSLEV